ncbi:MAG: transposase [Methanobacterium sp.]|jgi:hypothetical protein
MHYLGVKKQEGISTLQSVLTLIFLAVIGKKRVSKGETIKDYGIAAIAGFSKMPSKSYLHNFLDQITVSCAENFQVASAKAFKKLGIFKSKVINLDGHFIGYFGKSKIGKDKHPTRNISMRGIKAFFCQDQETGNPIIARVAYPRKGLTPENVTIPMLKIVKDILPEMEKVVFDKWFSVGSLLEYLDKKMKLKYITLIKLYENRIEEMKSIPMDEFKPLIGTDRLIGFKETNLRNFSGSMKLIVVRFFEDGIEKYYGYLTNDYESSEEQILKEKSWRWRIENFFKNCNFLGIDALPSLELNKIAAMLAMKLFAFNLIACLRKDLGGDFEKKTVESIFEELIEFPAFVKTNGERIIVTFHGNYKDNQKEAIEKLMKKWDETGMNVPISWLGNRRIEVRFK